MSPGRRRDGQLLQRATLSMAAGTTLSRLTGVGRVIALAIALGQTHLQDAYNLANTAPNMLYDIVLGGILSATFIPVFVDRLANRSERDAWRSISSVITLSVIVLVTSSVVVWVLAPEILGVLTVLNHASTPASHLRTMQERQLGTSLLRWFVPQVALYGLISIATALLNTRQRFAAPAWVPILNNAVCIAVLVEFRVALSGRRPSLDLLSGDHGLLVLLGLGTTLGVAVQAIALVPSLWRSGLGQLRWHLDLGDDAVHDVVRFGAWTFGFVMANQIALGIVLALAGGITSASDPVSSYQNAYAFMQMPYAVVAVSVMSAVTPDLARRWSTGDEDGFVRRLSSGLRTVLAVIIPASVGLLLLARPAVALLLGHGSSSTGSTSATGSALAFFALALPGFCTFLYVVRCLQAMQRTRTAFWLYVIENGINVIAALLLVHPLGVRGLALALAVAYSVAALCGLVLFKGWFGRLGRAGTWRPLRRVSAASISMGLAVVVVSALSGATSGVGLLIRVVLSIVVGVSAFVGTSVLGARRAAVR